MATGAVGVAPAGQSYTFLGGAVMPCDLETGQVTGDAVHAEPSRAATEQAERVAERVQARRLQYDIETLPTKSDGIFEVANRLAASKPKPRTFGPREVVKAARARIKEIRAELKKHAALKRELSELERLVSAAKQPVAAVRDIRRSAG